MSDAFDKAYKMLEEREATIRQQASEIERLRDLLRVGVEVGEMGWEEGISRWVDDARAALEGRE